MQKYLMTNGKHKIYMLILMCTHNYSGLRVFGIFIRISSSVSAF